MIEAGVDLIEVQKYLGHHSILTTVRYTHLTDQTKHHAIDVAANPNLSCFSRSEDAFSSCSVFFQR